MGFAIIPEEVQAVIDQLNPNAIRFLIAISSFMNAEGECWPGVNKLNERARVPRSQSRRDALKILKDFNFIEVISRPKTSDLYKWGSAINKEKLLYKASVSVHQEASVSVPPETNRNRGVEQKASPESLGFRSNEQKARPEPLGFCSLEGFKEEKEVLSSSSNPSSPRFLSSLDEQKARPLGEGLPEYIRLVLEYFLHEGEGPILAFFVKARRLLVDDQPIEESEVERITRAALEATRDWPGETDSYTSPENWFFFKKNWSRIRNGESKFHIWGLSSAEIDQYYAKNYVPSPDEIRQKEKDLAEAETRSEKNADRTWMLTLFGNISKLESLKKSLRKNQSDESSGRLDRIKELETLIKRRREYIKKIRGINIRVQDKILENLGKEEVKNRKSKRLNA